MKISLNWLTDYVDINIPAEELADLIRSSGFEVDEIIHTDTDIILDVEVTSNRSDLLGHLGMAREISAAAGLEFKPPVFDLPPTNGNIHELVSVDVLEPELCPRYTARVIRGVKVGASPDWLVERLEAVGLRSVNNIVDITNFVLMEYSQPLHAFDYDKLAGKKIIVRCAKKSEEMVSIDETKCTLDEDMLVIADAEKPIAIAAVMGGMDTEVNESTVNLLIESAQFTPLSTRSTSRKLGIMSESNYRFERGVDAAGVDMASRRACAMIVDLAGGELAGGVIDVWPDPPKEKSVCLRPSRTEKVLGMDIPADRQREILTNLGFSPREDDAGIICEIPSYRRDISREIDLIEEVARLNGYDKIPLGSEISHAVRQQCEVQRIRKEAAGVLLACGFNETVNFSFIDLAEAQLFGCESVVSVDPLNRKTNNSLRGMLIPSLLKVLRTNRDMGTTSLGIYELSAVFPAGADGDALPLEHTELAIASVGQGDGQSDLRAVRGTIEELTDRLAAGSDLEIKPDNVPGMQDDAAAKIIVGGKTLGVMGIVSSEVLEYYGLEKPVAMAAIDFDGFSKLCQLNRTYKPIGRFPSVKRNLSFILDEDVTWGCLAGVIAGVHQPLRTDVEYVTTWRGKSIAKNKKSVTLAVTYRSNDATLRGEQVDEQVDELVLAVKKELFAEMRTV